MKTVEKPTINYAALPPENHDVATEKALVQKAQGGDDHAKERLVAGHMKMLRGIAKKYARLLQVDAHAEKDLFQAAVAALMVAIDKHDGREARLSAFAHTTVKKAALKALSDANRAIAPRGWRVERDIRRVRAASAYMEDDAQIAKELGLTVERVELLRAVSLATVPLDQPARPGAIDPSPDDERKPDTLAEIQADPTSPKPDVVAELTMVLADMPNVLTETERSVLLLHAVAYDWDADAPRYQEVADEMSTGKCQGGEDYESLLRAVTDVRGIKTITRQAVEKTVKRAQKKMRDYYYH
jgi:RNA polymerase sigma factor (sigma-70 family)